MDNMLAEAIAILKHLPDTYLAKALAAIQDVKREQQSADKQTPPPCPACQGDKIVRNGHKHGKQAFICRTCGKSFVDTSHSTLCNSHSGESVWKQVIRDTVNGVSLDVTAANLLLHHETVFNMRHKILFALEQEERAHPTALSGVCEADETYVLESYKGQKLPDDFWRKPRKHGAVAAKRGLSNEYVCICTGVEREGQAVAMAVNRAMAGQEEIDRVFGARVNPATLILSDGAHAYRVLQGKCDVHAVEQNGDGFYHINTVNGYHSFIKERHRHARGFATKYLNRYTCLFSKIFRQPEVITEHIYDLLCQRDNRYHTTIESQTQNLLEI